MTKPQADRPEFTVDEALRIADQNADSYENVASVSRTLAAEVRSLQARVDALRDKALGLADGWTEWSDAENSWADGDTPASILKLCANELRAELRAAVAEDEKACTAESSNGRG